MTTRRWIIAVGAFPAVIGLAVVAIASVTIR